MLVGNIFTFNGTYNFSTLAPTILGNSFTNQKVIGILTAKQAYKIKDVYTLHNSLVGVIPNLPASADDCTFILFEDSLGNEIVMANEYIDQNSISSISTVNIRIDILNAVTSDIPIIRTRLLELGYTNAQITTF